MSTLRLAEKSGILGLLQSAQETSRSVEVMGIRFPNRVGLAAGLDKEGDTIDALGRLGFGCIEIGTITPRRNRATRSHGCFGSSRTRPSSTAWDSNNSGIELVWPTCVNPHLPRRDRFQHWQEQGHAE